MTHLLKHCQHVLDHSPYVGVDGRPERRAQTARDAQPRQWALSFPAKGRDGLAR